jgi:hypothetical protein
MTARSSLNQRDERGHRPRLQFGECRIIHLSPTSEYTYVGSMTSKDVISVYSQHKNSGRGVGAFNCLRQFGDGRLNHPISRVKDQ